MPQNINDSLVEIGDTIEVTFRKERGIQQKIIGKVAKRIDSGNVRYYVTSDGATIFAAGSAGNRFINISLIKREPEIGATLFEVEFLDETKERIANG